MNEWLLQTSVPKKHLATGYMLKVGLCVVIVNVSAGARVPEYTISYQ